MTLHYLNISSKLAVLLCFGLQLMCGGVSLVLFSQNRDPNQQAGIPCLEPPDPESRHLVGISHTGDQ